MQAMACTGSIEVKRAEDQGGCPTFGFRSDEIEFGAPLRPRGTRSGVLVHSLALQILPKVRRKTIEHEKGFLMTEFWRAVLLGAVQGVTEFIPISSSGHLMLIHKGLGWSEFGLAYDVVLHLASLLAVTIYFRSDISRMAIALVSKNPDLDAERRLGWLVMAATAVTAVMALAFSDLIERAFSNIAWIGGFFLLTAAALVSSELLGGKRLHEISGLPLGKALLVGLAQAVALFPGVSRAGATMAAGMAVGLDREQSARFSFLMSVPIILLAGVKTGLDAVADPQPFIGLWAAFAGGVVAFVAAYASIGVLLAFLKRHSLYLFAGYTALLGAGTLIWQLS